MAAITECPYFQELCRALDAFSGNEPAFVREIRNTTRVAIVNLPGGWPKWGWFGYIPQDDSPSCGESCLVSKSRKCPRTRMHPSTFVYRVRGVEEIQGTILEQRPLYIDSARCALRNEQDLPASPDLYSKCILPNRLRSGRFLRKLNIRICTSINEQLQLFGQFFHSKCVLGGIKEHGGLLLWCSGPVPSCCEVRNFTYAGRKIKVNVFTSDTNFK